MYNLTYLFVQQEQGKRFYGTFCQCNDFSCPEDKGQLCGGKKGALLILRRNYCCLKHEVVLLALNHNL